MKYILLKNRTRRKKDTLYAINKETELCTCGYYVSIEEFLNEYKEHGEAIFTNQLSKNTTVQGLIDISDVVFELDILPSYTDIQELYPEFFL